MAEKEIGFQKKELTHPEKIYRLGEVAAAIIELRLKKPGKWPVEMAFDKLVDTYADLELDIDKLEEE